jgi:hypothetical protein
MRLLAQRQHAAGMARDSAGGSAMASALDWKLMDATAAGDVAEIQRLIMAGADPNAFEGTDGCTPLQRAAHNGHVATITALLAAGARVDGANDQGTTPLMYAALVGHAAAVAMLLAAGADALLADQFSDTALHLASMFSRPDAARTLVEAGARTDVRNCSGKRSIDKVCAQLTRSLARLFVAVAPATAYDSAAPPHRWSESQVCEYGDKTTEPALRALLAAAAPWSRRRPVAIACYGVEWEWEA